MPFYAGMNSGLTRNHPVFSNDGGGVGMSEHRVLQAEPYVLSPEQISQFRELASWRESNYGDYDPLRILHFQRVLQEVAGLPEGEYLEMGTQYGGTAKIIFDLMPTDRKLFCFDTFTGFNAEDLRIESTVRPHGFTTESIRPLDPQTVRSNILGSGPAGRSERLVLVPGHVPGSLGPFGEYSWRFAHFDMDLYEPTRLALDWVWPRMVPGGILLFHDYDALPTVRKAVDEFVNPLGLLAIPLSDRFGSAIVFKPPQGTSSHRMSPKTISLIRKTRDVAKTLFGSSWR